MRKLFSLLTFMMISVLAYSQNVHTVFITDAEVVWLDKEVGDLAKAHKEMEQALETDDYTIIATKKTALMKSINRMSTNSNIMRQKIETEINPPAKRSAIADLDTPEGYYYNKKKANDKLQELKLSSDNWSELANNAIQLKVIKDKLDENGYKFGPKHSQTDQNMDMITEMIKLAEASNSIIKRSKVD